MNRDDFIKKQLNKFGCFNVSNMAIWKADYEEALQEPNIDFDRLDKKIIKDWDSTFNAPSTKWLIGAKQDCIPKDERCDALKNIEQLRKNVSAPPPEVVAKIEAMKKKMRIV